MAIQFESTVEDLPSRVADLDAPGGRRVLVTVLDEQDEAKLTELRALIADGLVGEPISSQEAFATIRDNIDDV